MVGRTRTIRQTVTFRAPPRQVYELLMDSKKHQSLSGQKAKISRKVGGRFTAWGPHISGVNLVVKPGRKIVQAWRAKDWWPDHYSIAMFDFEPVQRGTRLTFTQIGVPPHRYNGHYNGWINAYWRPMKEVLKSGVRSTRTRAEVTAARGRIASGRL